MDRVFQDEENHIIILICQIFEVITLLFSRGEITVGSIAQIPNYANILAPCNTLFANSCVIQQPQLTTIITTAVCTEKLVFNSTIETIKITEQIIRFSYEVPFSSHNVITIVKSRINNMAEMTVRVYNFHRTFTDSKNTIFHISREKSATFWKKNHTF